MLLGKGLNFSVLILNFSVLIILIIRKREGREQESTWSPTLYRLRGSFSRFYAQRMKVNRMCQLDLMIVIEIFYLFSKTGVREHRQGWYDWVRWSGQEDEGVMAGHLCFNVLQPLPLSLALWPSAAKRTWCSTRFRLYCPEWLEWDRKRATNLASWVFPSSFLLFRAHPKPFGLFCAAGLPEQIQLVGQYWIPRRFQGFSFFFQPPFTHIEFDNCPHVAVARTYKIFLAFWNLKQSMLWCICRRFVTELLEPPFLGSRAPSDPFYKGRIEV